MWLLLTRITGADGEEDLADVHTGYETIRLAEGTTHASLQSIGASTRQHLVDADDVVWMSANTQMEAFLSGDLDEVSFDHTLVSLCLLKIHDSLLS